MRFPPYLAVAAAATLTASALSAQTPTPAASPGIEISGLMFGSVNTRLDSAARAAWGGKSPSAFTVDRVYITFKAPAGDNGAFRLTTDIYQNTNPASNAYYQGWAIRMKYAWFQYTMLRGALGKGSRLVGRVGSIHNVVIDQGEGPWPRFLSAIAVERVPYFTSADIGVGALLTLGNNMGELYATLTNGSGYSSYDKDRFKDPAIRLTLTPLANSTGYLKALSIMPWIYKGSLGSRFAAGGPGQVGPGLDGAVTDAMARDRYGIFLGVRDRRLTFGADLAWQRDGGESGANTAASPRAAVDSTGRVIAGYLVARPIEWATGKRSPFAMVARYDRVTPNTDPSGAGYAGASPAYDYSVVGVTYDLNQRFTLAADWQLDRPVGFTEGSAADAGKRPRSSILFLHWNATF
jgi:hypothetical protein